MWRSCTSEVSILRPTTGRIRGRRLGGGTAMHPHLGTGTIWEFYDAEGGDPREVARKPHTPFNRPSPDYLGHNPLLARLWEECEE